MEQQHTTTTNLRSRKITNQERERIKSFGQFQLRKEKEEKKKLTEACTTCFFVDKIKISTTSYKNTDLHLVTVIAPNGYGVYLSRKVKSMDEIKLCEEQKVKAKAKWQQTLPDEYRTEEYCGEEENN